MTRHDRRDPLTPPVISESQWVDRRGVLKLLGFTGLGAAGIAGCGAAYPQATTDDRYTMTSYPGSESWVPSWKPAGGADAYPAKRASGYVGGRPITPEDTAAKYNNFYEFLPGRAGPVYRHVDAFQPRPWTVEIAGEVEQAREVDVDRIAAIAPLEERIYRFRCVEAWSMVVPWTGIPMAKFIEFCRPKKSAKYIKFVSFVRPEQAPGQKSGSYSWPYYEALRLDEARHPLTLLVTGIFGHGLPAQHGAPIRVIVPWKYGYKSPKSFVRVEFSSKQPGTFWSDLQPREYPFLSNVEPEVPHPRWSQATERDLATGDRIPTLPYNGYAEEVASLYGSK